MTASQVRLLLLDAHGIVLNAFWPSFLLQLARILSQPPEEVQQRWQSGVRDEAWSGGIDDAELWRRLTEQEDSAQQWHAVLEAGYTLGPAVPHLGQWRTRVPIWLLSNHRTHWLLPRLERFGVRHIFSRVLVSDRIGAMKPHPAAFAEVLESVRHPASVLFVDDQSRNVESARLLGIQALLADRNNDWVTQVNKALGLDAMCSC